LPLLAPALLSPSRRRFLKQTAIALSATPFLAAAYGLLYGRLDVQVTRLRIRLARLPDAFEGFRIAQLSDFHIGPFMTADEIRRCVTITNRLNPDLVVMTGNYIAWDPSARAEVVQALAGLRAPSGVFGCLGNHETITQTEQSITRLFAARGIRILRQERAPIQLQGETLMAAGVMATVIRPAARCRSENENARDKETGAPVTPRVPICARYARGLGLSSASHQQDTMS
jgi:uncharacterized protein